MLQAIRDYVHEFGWHGLIRDRFSPTRAGLADWLRAIAERINPQNKLDVVLAYRHEMASCPPPA